MRLMPPFRSDRIGMVTSRDGYVRAHFLTGVTGTWKDCSKVIEVYGKYPSKYLYPYMLDVCLGRNAAENLGKELDK